MNIGERAANSDSNSDSAQNWSLPTKLKEMETKFREIDDINELDTNNDFGSYRKVLLTNDIKDTQIEAHNDLLPRAKIHLISKISKVVGAVSILDAGCGMGFTTQAIAEQYPMANVLGVDISQDAIAFATKTHVKAKFKSVTINPEEKELGKFDIIFCFEFYPFTRNNNVEIQSSFINYFSKQLKSGGEIIIYQKWDNPLSLSTILQDVRKTCPKLNFQIIRLPHHKVHKYLRSIIFSKFVCFFIGKFIGKDLIKNTLIITKF